jgi:hypothetical protein
MAEETKGKWVSPNGLMEGAKGMMLDGREPETNTDWMLIVNFLVVNIKKELALPATQLMLKLYDMPVTKEQAEEIYYYHYPKEVKDAVGRYPS